MLESFIDFRKALIKRGELGFDINFYKIVDGKLFQAIHNMYKNFKACIKVSSQTSEYFNIYQGDRQDENMSTVLFCLFINDLGYFMQANGCLQIDFEIQHG